MGEFRQDRTSGAWVIIAPERKLRTRDLPRRPPLPEPARQLDPDCPFCPGNEKRLPGILFEMPDVSPPGWKVRAVPNKFPIVRLSTPVPPALEHGVAMAAYGSHEVVIESPRHDDDLDSFSNDQVAALMSTYRRRFLALLAQPGIETVILFRNHGAAGGASLPHPHSQMVGLALAPPRLRSLADRMLHHCHETGRCLTCDTLESERADGDRVVEETGGFMAVVPFAASVPFEIRIVPKRHQASFLDMSEAERSDFGLTLRNTLRRLRTACNDPPYNFALESFDFLGRDARHAHWWLRIAPDLVTWGGFELAAGIPINPSRPEDDAAWLRKAAQGGSGAGPGGLQRTAATPGTVPPARLGAMDGS